MRIQLMDMNKFIGANELKEIKNSKYFEVNGFPTEDGLFSYEIFGPTGSDQRRLEFAYIDLSSKFLHPLVYDMLVKSNKLVKGIISGDKMVSLDARNRIIENEIEGQTGINWLYNNWDVIVWDKEAKSIDTANKLYIYKKMPKELVFVDKWVVIPAYYRDTNVEKKSAGDEVNKYYHNLIDKVRLLRGIEGYSSISANTKYIIQEILLKIYNHLSTSIKGKKGLIKGSVMEKRIEGSSRSVIAAQDYNVESPKDIPVKFDMAGMPMASAVTMYLPFLEPELEEFFRSVFKGKLEGRFTLGDNKYSMDEVTKLLQFFVKDPNGRLTPVMGEVLHPETHEYKKMPLNIHISKNGVEIEKRLLTLTDVIFIALLAVTEDKYA